MPLDGYFCCDESIFKNLQLVVGEGERGKILGTVNLIKAFRLSRFHIKI